MRSVMSRYNFIIKASSNIPVDLLREMAADGLNPDRARAAQEALGCRTPENPPIIGYVKRCTHPGDVCSACGWTP